MSISLNDHERRIKDFEGKITNINDRITSLEGKPSGNAYIYKPTERGWFRSFSVPTQYQGKRYYLCNYRIHNRVWDKGSVVATYLNGAFNVYTRNTDCRIGQGPCGSRISMDGSLDVGFYNPNGELTVVFYD